jgi:hypothetical protein
VVPVSLESLVDYFRGRQEDVSGSTCTITRESTGVMYDDETGTYLPSPPDEIYDGWCRLRGLEPQENVHDVAGDQVTVNDYTVAIDWETVDVEVDDVVTLTSSLDPRLVGRPMKVLAVGVTDDLVARRLTVRDLL